MASFYGQFMDHTTNIILAEKEVTWQTHSTVTIGLANKIISTNDLQYHLLKASSGTELLFINLNPFTVCDRIRVNVSALHFTQRYVPRLQL